MLFSHPALARYLSERFECAWESVRPVPKVTIDFGNGRTLKRTLNGNILTWFCDPQGRVVDLVPGIVSPRAYAKRASRALALFKTMTYMPRPMWLAQYHAGGAVGWRPPHDPALAPLLAKLKRVAPQLDEDTEFNREQRDPLARKILAANPGAGPRELRDEVYEDVMGTDLSDPYLGLAPAVLGGELGRR